MESNQIVELVKNALINISNTNKIPFDKFCVKISCEGLFSSVKCKMINLENRAELDLSIKDLFSLNAAKALIVGGELKSKISSLARSEDIKMANVSIVIKCKDVTFYPSVSIEKENVFVKNLEVIELIG